jgi:fibrillarin-like pre-rRNA processing protein
MIQRMTGVFEDRGKIYTENSVRGHTVYGERLFTDQGTEYRQWEPKRSKLGAAIMKNTNLPDFDENQVWLYLGSSTGTTVSHLSDIVKSGIVYAVEFAPRVMRDFIFMAEKRKNLAPILADAFHPENYEARVTLADVLFQDISQKSQVEIFLRNLRFLKEDGYAILAVKARSIDVAAKPRFIFDQVRQQLQKELKIIDYKTLEPFEADHAIFVCKKK